MNNSFSSAMKPKVYNVLQNKLFTQGLDRELMDLREGLEVDLLSLPTNPESSDRPQL